jgi:uncharacterized protein (TIGR03435 family)
VIEAYDVQTFQVEAPDWIETERYDIAAIVSDRATKEQVRVMWQNLLRQRFGMVVHHESKEFPVHELTIAQSGSKLIPTEPEPVASSTGPPKLDKYGMLLMGGAGALLRIEVHGNSPMARMAGKALTSGEIAARLAQLLKRPVLDRTGLTGRFDFSLEFVPDMSGVPPPPGVISAPRESAIDPGSNLVSVVEKQLGLKLTARKANLDVIVIDHAEKIPTEN